MPDDTIILYQEQRKLLWKKVKAAHHLMARAVKLAASLEARYRALESDYERCDKSLALLDGRFARLAAASALQNSTRKRRPAPDLTEQDIMDLAKQFGIKLEDL